MPERQRARAWVTAQGLGSRTQGQSCVKSRAGAEDFKEPVPTSAGIRLEPPRLEWVLRGSSGNRQWIATHLLERTWKPRQAIRKTQEQLSTRSRPPKAQVSPTYQTRSLASAVARPAR